MFGEKYPIIKIEETEKIELFLESKVFYYTCPLCGSICHATHDVHSRHIQDTPIHNKETWINIDVKEFECCNENCSMKTFTEYLPFAGRNQVMTYYLQYYIVILGIYMSSSATSLILSLIGVKVSADTIDNLLRKIKIIDDPNVERIGIDDVSLRKGISYATAIYNLDNHQIIALLEGREKEDIIPWLKEHPNIKFVARDRASAYAEAIKEVLPDAIQVADRFHLFLNLTQYLKDMFYKELPDKIVIKDGEILDRKATKVLKELVNIDESILKNLNYDNTVPVDESNNEISFISVQHNIKTESILKHAENRLKKYELIKRLREEYFENKSKTLKELALKYGISHNSAIKYKNMTEEEVELVKEKRNGQKKKTEIMDYCNMIYKMLVDGIEFEYIFAYVKQCGFKGTDIHLKNYIAVVASNNNIRNIPFCKYDKFEYSKDETIIKRSEIFKYILTINEKKQKNQTVEENFLKLKEKFPAIEEIQNIFHDFHTTIFSEDEFQLDKFINKYNEKISSFCNGLKMDIAAVKNAISTKINSGFVEGNNNKFKLIKRIVYGKQKICNLFNRCWLSFASTLEDLSILKLAMEPFL